VERAGKVMGLSVRNLQDQNLGKVENLIVDLNSGRIAEVILATGGFLGMGGELSAVPPQSFTFAPEHDRLQIDTTTEALANAPHFKSNQWPDVNDPTYAGGVYQSYHVTPYFDTNSVDNTAQNVRDRSGNTLTPLDQGNNQADIDTTAHIRKDILARDGLSTNARNVKIITLNGHVTLRGPVNNADESATIMQIAIAVAQPGNVDNQLQVTTDTLPTSSNNQ
jgi:hypothetical protein